MALAAADKPDQAADVTLTGRDFRRLFPSNFWRVAEVVSGIEGRDAPDAATVHDAFRDTYSAQSSAS